MRQSITNKLRILFKIYIVGVGIYGLWVFIILGFRESCILSQCAPLPHFNSNILNIVLSVLPDQAPFAVILAIGRGIFWLPNFLLSVLTDKLTFFDWILVRDSPSMLDFYKNFDRFLL